MTDPFAANGTDDPWAEPQAAPSNDAEANVAQTDQNYVTVILKGGKGYGAPSVSIRGASISDALAQVKGQEAELKELLQFSARYGIAYGKLVDGDAGQGGGGQQQRQQSGGQAGRPANANEHPQGKKEYCAHGEMVFRSGVKNGKAWGGFFCPQPKGSDDQCDPKFERNYKG